MNSKLVEMGALWQCKSYVYQNPENDTVIVVIDRKQSVITSNFENDERNAKFIVQSTYCMRHIFRIQIFS